MKQNGFTLIELMIVMAIMGILAMIVSGTFVSSLRRGRDTRRKNDLRSVASALEAYYNDKGKYPTGVGGVMNGCGVGDTQPCNWGGQFKDKNNTLYMTQLPTDPSIYRYYYVSGGTSYKLYAKLENTLDMGNGVIQDPPGYPGIYCNGAGTVLCTYAIASSNVTLP